MTKIALKSDRYSSFGGIFYVMDEFFRLVMDTLIDRTLGLRSNFCGYQYSEIISSLFWIYFCGGDCIEDIGIGTHLGSQLKLRPGTTIPSLDTLLRGIKELTEENTVYTVANGSNYSFITSEKWNSLLLDMLQQSGQLKAGKYDLDFDHEFIPTKKYDTKYSYKKERGYFPGIATIGEMLVGIENREGNTNVRFHHKDTLGNIFERLARRGIFIDRCRMDCGSFSEETIRMVHRYCSKFYIRASRCETLYERMSEIENWNAVLIMIMNQQKWT